MDMEDAMIIGLLVATLLVFMGGLILAFDSLVNGPIAADQATQFCFDHGFDRYSKYSRIPFTTEARGIKCEYVSKYYIDGNGIPILKVGD